MHRNWIVVGFSGLTPWKNFDRSKIYCNFFALALESSIVVLFAVVVHEFVYVAVDFRARWSVEDVSSFRHVSTAEYLYNHPDVK